MPANLDPRRIPVAAVFAAIGEGWRCLRHCLLPATALAAVFAVAGAAIYGLLWQFGLAPMMLPLAGGFLLVGPAVLAGFFGLRRAEAAGHGASLSAALAGFRQAPRGLWVMAAVCTLLFVIWLTDAATVYSFMIGSEVPEAGRVIRFHAFTSLMGAVLAAIVFCVSAFSVPLLFDRRATLVAAVTASVRAVFGNFLAVFVWALILAGALIATALCPPLLLLSLPCLAFASDLLYLEIFPPD